MSKLIARVNRVTVSAELLGEVLDMHAAMPAEDRGAFEVRAVRLFELLDQKGLGKDRGILAIAIDFRLVALVRLQRDNALRGWSMPGGERGMNIIHADLLKAAAKEPLIENSAGEASFDVESFQRRVLESVEVHGQS